MNNIKVLIILLVITYCGCIPQQLPLSKNEKLLETKLSKDFGCLVNFKHDYLKITKNSFDGVFGVFMCDDLCDLDYNELLKICKDISVQVSNNLSHKKLYKSIVIGFSKSKKLDSKTEKGVCFKSFEFLVSKPDSLLSFRKLY